MKQFSYGSLGSLALMVHRVFDQIAGTRGSESDDQIKGFQRSGYPAGQVEVMMILSYDEWTWMKANYDSPNPQPSAAVSVRDPYEGKRTTLVVDHSGKKDYGILRKSEQR